MPNKKTFILLPDGIGLRNFAFTNFHKLGLEKEFDIVSSMNFGKLDVKSFFIENNYK